MVTAQEILQRIKENGQTIVSPTKSNIIGKSNSISASAISGGVHRLHTVEVSIEKEFSLYLHWQTRLLSIQLYNKKSIEVRRKFTFYSAVFPKVTNNLDNCTWYYPELTAYIALYCSSLQQLIDTRNKYLTGLSIPQQKLIYTYLLKFKEQHNADDKLIESNTNKTTVS